MLTNGQCSDEICVDGAEGEVEGVLNMPQNHELVGKAMAYADEKGVFNLFLKDRQGETVCHYDPKKYGEIRDAVSHRIEMHEEIIGVYGTYPKRGDKIFSSFGFVLLSSTRHRI